MANITHWETTQTKPNYLTQDQSFPLQHKKTQPALSVKHQPWLTLQSRQLWQSSSSVNQYVSWDTYRSMIKRNSLLTVIYTDNVHWAYLLCFSCNLPTSLCCPLVCRHKHTLKPAPPQLWEGFTMKLYKGKEWKPECASTRLLHRRAERSYNMHTHIHQPTLQGAEGRAKRESLQWALNTHQKTSGVSKWRFGKTSLHKGLLYWL